jgi:hypothetical protein
VPSYSRTVSGLLRFAGSILSKSMFGKPSGNIHMSGNVTRNVKLTIKVGGNIGPRGIHTDGYKEAMVWGVDYDDNF